MIELVAILVFAAALFSFFWWGSSLILNPPGMSPMFIFPEQFSLRYEKILFKTRDGLLLKGWFIPSPTGDKRTLVMCHGWSDNKGELLQQTCFLNTDGGFNLLYFDFRSHGESEGTFTTIGGLETLDFDAAIAWLKKTKPECALSVGVFGLSMGAAVAIASMPKYPDLSCVVVESPFSDYRTVIKRWGWNNLKIPYYPLIALILFVLRLRVNNAAIDLFNPVESAPKISPRPLFVIGGANDRLMTPDDVKKVFSAAHEPKQLWMVPDARHAKCREAAGREYDTRVIAFFRENL